MSDIIFEENEENAEIILSNPEELVAELEASLRSTVAPVQGDVRRRLEDLLYQKRLEEELDDEFSDD